jgi:hypothetical protein
MYEITSTYATSMAARFRMSAFRCEPIAFPQGQHVTGAVSLGQGAIAPVTFKDATSGVRAWSPPVG